MLPALQSHCALERLAARSGAQVTMAGGAGEGSSADAARMRRMVDAFAEYARGWRAGRRAQHRAAWPALEADLEAARLASPLPETAANEAAREDWLVELRCAQIRRGPWR